jgi:hypothetical protein
VNRFAWTLFGFALALVPFSLVLAVVAADANLRGNQELVVVNVLVLSGMAILYGAVGALVASRRPRNPIGWILCFVSVAVSVVAFCSPYADHSLYGDGSLPAARYAAWLANWLLVPALFGAPASIFLLFPTGRPPSPRWRPVVWVLGLAMAGAGFGIALRPGELFSFPGVVNPLGIGGAAGEVMAALDDGSEIVAIPVLLASLAAMLLRLRRARGEERQQVKWVVYAAALGTTSFAISFVPEALGATRVEEVFFFLGVAGIALIPVAAGLAILRYRLYDIDVVINRTLVYGSVTALLAGAYLGLILLFQLAFSPLTEENSLAVALSTLAVAALFRPARNRVQALVDRRFYRRRYDAQRTLEGFASRLREEVDLDALRVELTGVVAETMQPAHVSLWLREVRS